MSNPNILDFSILPGKQREVAEYLYTRRGLIISYEELIGKVWGVGYDPTAKDDRRCVHRMVARIRQAFGEECIRSYDSRGYMWVSDAPPRDDNGTHFREIILSSEGKIDGGLTIARMLLNNGNYIVQLSQTNGRRVEHVNLLNTEFEDLCRFVKGG